MAKSKRDEKAEEKESEYEFKLPDFDEQAFIRREIAGAKASFWALGIGALAGVLSVGLYATGLDWKLGWLPILLAVGGLGYALQRLGFSEEITKPKALIGSYFMVFFTALAVWIGGVNIVA